MTAIHTLSVVIGAALKGNFGATMSSGISQLGRLGQAIKQLDASGKTTGKFQQLHKDTLLAKRGWMDAEKQVKSLAMQMAATTNPSKALVTEFERSKTAALKAKTAYLQKREALHNLDNEIRKSGQDIQNLISQQTKLGASLQKLKGHYVALDRIMQKRQGVLAQRANLRGQLFDAVALGAALGAPIKAAIDFESAMADVRKVVNFDTPDGLQKLGETLKIMSREIPLSAAGLAQIAASGGQLGIAAKDLATFTNIVAKMATAFDMSAEEAGDAMAKLANVYQIPITEMSKLGDAINHLSDNTAAKAKDMVPALNRIGGTARQFGLTPVQASALAGSFISLGKAPEKAGTAINAMLSKLQTAGKQGKKFQDALRQMGMSAKQLEKDIGQDAQGALVKFLEAMEKMDKQTRSGILFDLFGMEYQDDVALLVGSLNEYNKAVSMINDETKFAGSMQREFANRANTTANNLQLLKNGLAEVGMNLGSVLLPPLNALVKVLRTATTQMAGFAEQHPILTKLIMGVTAALIGGKIAAITLGYAWTFIQGGALALATAWRALLITITLIKAGFIGVNSASLITAVRMGALAFGGALQALGASFMALASRVFPAVIAGFRALTVAMMTNPVGAIVGGIAIAATLVVTNWESVKSFFMTIWEPIKPVWEAFGDWLGKFWEKIKTPFKAVGSFWDRMWGKKTPPELPVPAMQPVSESLKNPLSLAPKTAQNNTQNNSFNINVQASPNQDSKAVADEVMRRLKAQSRGALYDPVGALP